MLIKDVVLAEDAPKTLLLEKHKEFLLSYGNKPHTDYVSNFSLIIDVVPLQDAIIYIP